MSQSVNQLIHLSICPSTLNEGGVAVQVGGWLASWLWSVPAAPQADTIHAGQGSGQQPHHKPGRGADQQASATGAAAWDLIAAHAWDLLETHSLRQACPLHSKLCLTV